LHRPPVSDRMLLMGGKSARRHGVVKGGNTGRRTKSGRMDTRHRSGHFGAALAYATELHAGQKCKGTSIPYIAHLLGVASLAFEYGPDEDQAIATLLHDAVEHQGGIDAWSQVVDLSVLHY